MAMTLCDECCKTVNLDYTEGFFDIVSREGDKFDFVCGGCLEDEDNFKYDEEKDTYIKDEKQ